MSEYNPEADKKGKAFESFVCTNFIKSRFEILYRTNDYGTVKEAWVKNTECPDFQISSKGNTKEIVWIEAKFRTFFPNDKIIIKQVSWEKFKELDKNEPVFFIIGLGGSASLPERISIIPFRKLNESFISINDFNKYSTEINTVLDYQFLLNLLGANSSSEIQKTEQPKAPLQVKKKQFESPQFIARNYLIIIIIFIVALLGFEIFYNSNNSTLSKTEMVDAQKFINDYYSAAEKGDLNFIENHLADTLIFWFSKNNILKSNILTEEQTYFSTYPERHAEIVQGTFTSSEMGNGISKISYLLNYSYRKRGTEKLKSVRLKISVIIKELLILGMQEEKIPSSSN